MARTFELERDTEMIYGIITVRGNALWYHSREERDIAYLEMQN